MVFIKRKCYTICLFIIFFTRCTVNAINDIKAKQERCRNKIEDEFGIFFRRPQLLKHVFRNKHDAQLYFVYMKDHLEVGQVQSPFKFCEDKTEQDECRTQLSHLFLKSVLNEYNVFPIKPVDYALQYFKHIVDNHGFNEALLLPQTYCRQVLYRHVHDEQLTKSDEFDDSSLSLLDNDESSSSRKKKKKC